MPSPARLRRTRTQSYIILMAFLTIGTFLFFAPLSYSSQSDFDLKDPTPEGHLYKRAHEGQRPFQAPDIMPAPAPADPVKAITSNPLSTRADMQQLLFDLLSPLAAAQSSGGARIRLGHTGTHFDAVAAEMEGYARALWGLAPLLAAEPDHPLFQDFKARWIMGLDNGTNPDSDEYWGNPGHNDQRYVEMAAIGFSLAIAPKVFWEPLSEDAKVRVNKWLLNANNHGFPENNWRFFRVLVNVGLKRVGGEYSQDVIDETLDFIEDFYGPHGFPSDGINSRSVAYDYYATTFAIPFYSLIYSKLEETTDPVRAARFRQRAIQNVPTAVHLFDPEGHNVPFGRSMTYRFATSSFWAGAAFDQLDLPEGMTWGQVKGLLLRNIRFFTQKESVFNRDGSMSIGYLYPNLFMSEDYNSPQSPYWALKAFLVLALPESHPFWAAEEEAYPAQFLEQPYTVVKPWMQVLTHAAGHTFALSSGQGVAFPMRQAAAKYGKMAYSAAFGFSVPTGALGLQQHAPDSTFSVSDDGEGERWAARRRVSRPEFLEGGVMRSTWKPSADVEVITWLVPPPTTESAYHTRIHKVINRSSRTLRTADAGFAIHSTDGERPDAISERKLPNIASPKEGLAGRYEARNRRAALAVSRAGLSGVVDLLGKDGGKSGGTAAKVQDADGNSNLMAPRTVIPMIMGEVVAGETGWFATRVYALPFTETEGLKTAGWADGWSESEALGGSQQLQGDYQSATALEGLKKLYPFLK